MPFPAFRQVFGRLAALLVASMVTTAAVAEIRVVDFAGRSVSLPGPARRIVFADIADFMAISLLTDDPVAITVGWGSPNRLDAGQRELYRRRFPAFDRIASVGGFGPDTFSTEGALALSPDLVVLGHGFSAASTAVEVFEKAGIPVLLLADSPGRKIWDVAPRLSILGAAIGESARAERYIAFHNRHIERITAKIAKVAPSPPAVMVEVVTIDDKCCQLAGGKASSTSFVDLVGGVSIADVVTKQSYAPGSLEYILSRNPQVYIGLGGTDAGFYGLELGPGVPPGEAVASLERMRRRMGFSELPAFRQGRVHALWLPLFAGPYNLLAIELIAKWVHPDLFADLDPQKTLDEINRFLAVPLQGTYWASLAPSPDAKPLAEKP